MGYKVLNRIEQQNFRELKQKVTTWEKACVIDESAAKIGEVFAALDSGTR